MFNISDYLEKFSKVVSFGRQQKKEIQNSIEEVLNIKIDTDSIFIKDGLLSLKVSPAIKNTIYIKKALILKKMEEKGVENILDIK